METKGFFKRIAAVTMAALTIVTSSSVDVNLLSAKAAVNTSQVTESPTELETDESTSGTLKKKDTRVNAAAKLSFSTNEDLKRAVEDAGFTIDVKTGKVTAAAIKYNKTLLEMGTDFTATAKRTSVKKVDGKYNYVYTVTVTGKGKYTGTAKKTGVTMKSTIKPTTSTKKTVKKVSFTNTGDSTKVFQAVSTDGSTLTYDTGEGWVFTFSDEYVLYDPNSTGTSQSKQIAHFGDGTSQVTGGVTVSYKDNNTTTLLSRDTDYNLSWGSNTGTGETSGSFTVTSIGNKSNFWSKNSSLADNAYAGGITVRFRIVKSILAVSNGIKLNLNNVDHAVVYDSSTGTGNAETPFEYTGSEVKPDLYYKTGTDNSGNPKYEKLGDENQQITYSDNTTTVGNATLTAKIPNDGGTTETVVVNYTISKRDIGSDYQSDESSTTGVTVSVKDADKLVYTGKSVEPDVTVTDKDNNKTLAKDTDYTLSYSGNTNANVSSDGTAISGSATPTITIKGVGNYTGTITKTFNIKPKTVTDNDSEMSITVPDATFTGSEVSPTPQITYSPSNVLGTDGKQLTNTLVSGTDFDTTYTNNTAKAKSTDTNAPTATITFKGNYSGTVTENFSITEGDITSDGTQIIINGKTAATLSNGSGKNPIDAASDSYALDYSPDPNEYPFIQIKNANGEMLTLGQETTSATGGSSTTATGDYFISEPEWAGASDKKQTWPAVGTWKVTLKGVNNYSGELTVKVKIKQLDLGSDKLTVEDGYGFDSDGKSKVTLSYTNTIYAGTENERTYSKTNIEANGNFTIDPADNSKVAASKNVTLTLTGKGNYTGTRTVTTGNGKNLADAVESNDDSISSDIRIRSFDPFTGQELTGSSIAMPYYGDSISPHFSVEIKENDTWTAIPSNQFDLGTPTKVDNSDPTNYLYTAKVELKANSNNTKVYGTKEITFNVARHSLAKSNSDGSWSNDLSEDISFDASGVSSSTDLSSIGSGLKLSLNPEYAGKFIAIIKNTTTNSDGSTTTSDGSISTGASTGTTVKAIDNPNSKAADNLRNDSNTLAYWTAPSITGDGTLTYGTDYTVAFPKNNNGVPINNGKVVVTGLGNYKEKAIITLGEENIGNDDFYILYNGTSYSDNPAALPDIDYDATSHVPTISLYKKALSGQQSPTKLTEGADYRVAYINPDGDRIDKKGWILNDDGEYVAENSTITGASVDSDGYLKNSEGKYVGSDGKVAATGTVKAKKSTHDFSQAGDYKIILTGITTSTTISDSSASTTTKGNYFGTRTVTYKVVASTSALKATFSKTRVFYSVDSDGNADTVKPDFAYASGAASTSAIKLTVKADGTTLTQGKDYKVNWSDDLNEPGTKTFTITGINKYKGQSTTASYQVVVSMSELSNSKGLLTSDPDMSGTKQSQDMFYDGGSVLKTKAGDQFSPDNVTIKTETGYELVNGEDYSIDIDGYGDSLERLYSDGTHSVTFKGNGAFTSSFTLTINVIITRAGLIWSGDSTTQGNDSTNLILPWRPEGYTLGQGAMAMYKKVNGVRTTVNLTGSDTIKVGDTKKNLSECSFSDVGTYTVVIEGPLGSSDSSTLTFSILYDLSTATIDLGIDSTPYTGSDYFATTGGTDGLSKIKVYPAGSQKEMEYSTDYGIDRKYNDSSASGDFSKAGTIIVSLSEVSGRSKFFSDTKPTATYTITQLQENENYQLDASETNPLITYSYNGERQSPEGSESTVFAGKVKYQDGSTTRTLTFGTDYTVSYQSDSTNAGWKYITITGIGNYAGSKTFENAYQIKPYDLSANKTNIKIPDQYYTGKAITPQKISVTGVTGDLVFGVDYTIENPKNNTETGTETASVDIKGSDKNFTGTADGIKFTIKKLNLTTLRDSEGLLKHTDATYNKGASVGVDDHIQIFIPDGTSRIQLTRGKDYTLLFTNGNSTSATDPTNAGNYTVTIQAVTDSKFVEGSTTVSFKINPLNIEDVADQFQVANAAWTGAEVKPKVTFNGKDLDSTYTVTYENNTDACAKTRAEMLQYDPDFDENKIPVAIITGSGNYVGTIRKTFQIGQPFSEATVTPTNNTRLTYNGSSQKKEYTVTYTDGTGARQTLATARYTVTYPENTTDAGDKTVLFTANGGPLYGTKTVTYTIYPVSGSTWTVEFTKLTMDSTGQYTVQYQGAAITPEVKAYEIKAGGSRTEIPLKSGEITYKNNTAAGTASVSVSPNNYEGTKTLYFKILGVDLSGDDVYASFTDGITRRQYTGSALTPAVTVTFAGSQGTVTLRQDVDFSLTYENNTNAGAADVKITGIGNYSGSKTLDFDIYANLNDKTSVFTIPKQMYTGEAITELTGATIKAGGNDLKLGTDYTLSITSTDSFRTKGTAIFTAQSKYYEGTRTVQFEIGNDASMYTVLGVAATYVYDRQAHKPVPVVTDKQGTVYTVDNVSYASTSDGDTCINAGNVKMQITITSHGQSVTIPYNYTIEPRNINTASITPIADVDYNGNAHTPTIRITDGTNLLTGSPTSSDGTADYVYTYYNNVQPGTATVSIQGINNYTGVANIYFAINVKAAPQMIVTAMPSGRLKVTWNKVSGVSGYRLFYSSADGTQKQTTLSSSTKSTYITGLTRGVVYTVGLQSYITANGVNGYSTASVQQIATSTSKPVI
ncbi:MAG: hypothetical protein ACI4CS_06560, partial [Candidatus Weimeria sp.]